MAFNLFFAVDSKKSFIQLQHENVLLTNENNVIAQENNILESGIQSRQKNDAHAEKFAREELSLIYKNEEFISFKEAEIDEPK